MATQTPKPAKTAAAPRLPDWLAAVAACCSQTRPSESRRPPVLPTPRAVCLQLGLLALGRRRFSRQLLRRRWRIKLATPSAPSQRPVRRRWPRPPGAVERHAAVELRPRRGCVLALVPAGPCCPASTAGTALLKPSAGRVGLCLLARRRACLAVNCAAARLPTTSRRVGRLPEDGCERPRQSPFLHCLGRPRYLDSKRHRCQWKTIDQASRARLGLQSAHSPGSGRGVLAVPAGPSAAGSVPSSTRAAHHWCRVSELYIRWQPCATTIAGQWETPALAVLTAGVSSPGVTACFRTPVCCCFTGAAGPVLTVFGSLDAVRLLLGNVGRGRFSWCCRCGCAFNTEAARWLNAEASHLVVVDDVDHAFPTMLEAVESAEQISLRRSSSSLKGVAAAVLLLSAAGTMSLLADALGAAREAPHVPSFCSLLMSATSTGFIAPRPHDGKLVLPAGSLSMGATAPCAGGDHRERSSCWPAFPGRAAPQSVERPGRPGRGRIGAATVEEDGEAELGSTLLPLNLFEDYVHKTESRVANNLERISLMLEQLHLSIVCLYSEHDTDRELADELLTVMEQHSRPVRLVFQSEHPTEWSGKCSRSSRASSATSGRTSLLGLSRSVSVAETEDTEAKN
uniref:Reverse transcriptase domain-containing protein n=1 Tax=Macrostomum lignano TaxID=282301 RepID=A0A1I8FDN9_9PLAT